MTARNDSEPASTGTATTEPATTESASPPRRYPKGRLTLLAVAVALFVIGLDQLTKYLAQSMLTEGEPIPVIGSLLQLNLHYNSGAAFSMATGLTWVLTIVATVVVIIVIRMTARLDSFWWALGFGLLLGGALGNLIDRFFRHPGFARGWVVDFLHLKNFAVFNVADMAITGAGITIVILALFGLGFDGRRTRDAARDKTDDTESAVDQVAPVTRAGNGDRADD